MPKLTDTQLVILSGASQRPDGAVLPAPASLTINKGAIAAVLKGLLRRGLIEERPAKAGAEVWRVTDDVRIALHITEAGLAAINLVPADTPDRPATEPDGPTGGPRKAKPAKAPNPTATGTGTLRAGTKQALLVDLLSRKQGATIDEIGTATGWQAHSVRGAISGALKKKLGLSVTSRMNAKRGRVYRIETADQ